MDDVSAIICVAYHFKAAPHGGRILNDELLLSVKRPALFVQGSESQYCPIHEFCKLRLRMKGATALETLDGGDHNLKVG